jgi:multiple sugar transport system substrate-binding protein
MSKQSRSNRNSLDVSRRNVLGAAAVGAGLLAAPAVRAQSNTTLRFLNSETAPESQAVLRAAAAEYESKTGVKIVLDSSPISGAYPKVMAAINAGTPYDLATQGYIAHILQYANANLLLPMTDLVKKHSWGKLGAWSYQGENWFYPYDYNLVTVYYRKDLYKEKGLKVPTTWDQFLENARALTTIKDGNVERGGALMPIASDGSTNWASFGNLFAEGPKFYDDKWNVVLDAPANAKPTERFLDYFGELFKTMPPGMNSVGYAEMMGLFVTGKVAHTVYSGRVVEAIVARNPDLADKYGIFPSPDSGGKNQALSFAFDGFVAFKSKHSEETMKFLSWFIDNYYIRWLHSAWMNFQPVRLDIYEDPRWKDHPQIKAHWETMMEMKSYIDEKSKVTISSVDLVGPTIDLRPCKIFEANIMPEMLQNKVLKKMPSADCVATAAGKIRRIR